MLTNLVLNNFRGFREHKIDLPEISVIVGANNAGKSTIVEALRIVSLALRRSTTVSFSDPPVWTDLPHRARGVKFKPVGLDLEGGNVFHQYGEPPATITANFSERRSLMVMIGPHTDLFATLTNRQGVAVPNRTQAREQLFPQVAILPQIGPLNKEEVVLNTTYVHQSSETPLSSIHFRNQLNLADPSQFLLFKKLALSTWDGLRDIRFDLRSLLPGNKLALMIVERGFSAEVGWMGHGLQMWLQTMWFLAKSANVPTVILDEPDVYMHADLQRKLIRMVRHRHQQLIVATHSVEIISEVEPSQIVVVDRAKTTSSPANSFPAVQRVIDNIGGVHNIHLTRLWKSKCCLLVEGKDIKQLKIVQNILFPKSELPLDSIPSFPLGGWGNWPYAIGSKLILRNAAGEDIRVYCILDSDFYSDKIIGDRCKEAKDKGVSLHIWKSKEIENYFLVPETIARCIRAKANNPSKGLPTVSDVKSQLDFICESLREDTRDEIAHQYAQEKENRRGGVKDANKFARERLQAVWTSLSGKLSIVKGKSVISSISDWSQKNWHVSLNVTAIAQSMYPEEINSELREVVNCIEKCTPFPD